MFSICSKHLVQWNPIWLEVSFWLRVSGFSNIYLITKFSYENYLFLWFRQKKVTVIYFVYQKALIRTFQTKFWLQWHILSSDFLEIDDIQFRLRFFMANSIDTEIKLKIACNSPNNYVYFYLYQICIVPFMYIKNYCFCTKFHDCPTSKTFS